MQDRILNLSLRLTVVGLISVIALAACVVAYQGLYLGVTGQFAQAVARVTAAVGLGLATGLLIRYRGDLLDERY